MNFAKFVKKRMEEKRLSVRQVALQAGIDASFFSKILSGKRSPPAEDRVLKKLARIIDVDPVYLIFLTGRIPSEFQEFFLREDFIRSLYQTMKSAVSKETSPQAKVTKDYLPDSSFPEEPQNTGSFEDITEDLL